MGPTLKLNDQLLKIRQQAEERAAQRRAAETNLSYLDVTMAPIKLDALKLIPEDQARRLQMAVIEMRASVVAVAAVDPDNAEVKAVIKKFEDQGLQVKIFVSSPKGLEHVWNFYKFTAQDAAPITNRVNIEKGKVLSLAASLTNLKSVSRAIADFDYNNLSVTDFLEIVLAGALANRASDIHFEPEAKEVKLRYRIDGLLYDVVANLSADFYQTIISRIKLLSNLKINVQDRSQDGRFTIGLATKEVELRIAIAPSEFGEIIVMRILDPDAINISMAQLGLRPDDLEIIQTELKRPNGLVLNTGPTGSGKTTTLYAFLKFKSNSEIKIITIEDPIEYHLAGIEQTQVNTEAGYTFANGLRSIMRQDPDVILIGEVRDKDTAEIAIQAALTGHLVFSTIHANNAAGAIPRFLDLDVKSASIGPALNLIIAQRLVRRLCDKCKVAVKITDDLQTKIKNFLAALPKRIKQDSYQTIAMFKPKGCDYCASTGYRGRIAIFELLLNDPEYEKLLADANHGVLSSEAGLEELINKQSGEADILRYALNQGMATMQQDGILKALVGTTTVEEVEEVTGPVRWR